ncbi:MAG: amidohydrolase family protein [Firmicutes bacterium]|nr:amidohydrolase family protein [Bacillota bacterium]
MAFGFFKKKVSADTIFMNGHIYTQDQDFPWASAVACKDGKVFAVGEFEAMDEITSDETEIIDLKEKYMFPGFIEAHGTPVLKAFEDKYLSIDSEWDVEPILDLLSDYADEYDGDVIFGYGFNEKILERFETAEHAQVTLNEVETRRPIVLLSIDGLHFWVNSVAGAMIRRAAEEDEVEHLTTSYVLNVLNPFDFEEAEKAITEHGDALTDKGFTSFFNQCAPDHFTNLYLDSLFGSIGEGESHMKQRFFSSTFVNRPLHPQLILHRMMTQKTNCVELAGTIHADFLKLELSEDFPIEFSQEALDTICMETAEKGFHIYIDALDEESYQKAAATFAMLRDKGYKNHTFILASKYTASADEEDAFLSTWPTDYLNESVFNHVDSVEEAIDALTINAAEIVGMSKELGSIEKGKRADFTVFHENPFNGSLQRFSTMHADMTIVDGLIVYDAEEAAADEMCDMLFSMQL